MKDQQNKWVVYIGGEKVAEIDGNEAEMPLYYWEIWEMVAKWKEVERPDE